MFGRRSVGGCALAMALPSAALAQGFEYAAGTGQYRVTQVTKVAQEVMGQKNEFETSTKQLVSVAIARPKRDTLAMTVVLDSLSQTSPMGPQPGIEKLVGLKANAKLSPTGTVFSVQASDTTIEGAISIADNMGKFLPRIRARLVPGASWADTATGKVKQGGLDVERKTISRFQVLGDTTVGGEKSWKLSRDDSTSMTGSGVSQGQAMTMEGRSVGKGTIVLSQKGTFLGAEGGENLNIKLVLSMNGMEINVQQNAMTKVEKVK
jgi:hypothetical protein